MSLEKEYERPYQRNELESFQNLIKKYVRYINESMYPEKKFCSRISEHVKKFVPYRGECEYQLDYRSKGKDEPRGVATFHHPPLIKNHEKNKKSEKDGYKCYKINKLKSITYYSNKKLTLLFYKNHIPKPMIMTEFLQLIDKNPDSFKEWVCKFNCVKTPRHCENNNLVFRHVCYKFYKKYSFICK